MAKKELIVDFKGSMVVLKRRGFKETLTSLAIRMGVTAQHVNNWDGKAPYIVELVYRLTKKTKLDFPEIMKIIKAEETPSILLFIWNFCNETGLTFEEVVKEV